MQFTRRTHLHLLPMCVLAPCHKALTMRQRTSLVV